MSVTFRQATRDDMPSLRALWRDAFPSEPEASDVFLPLAVGRTTCLLAVRNCATAGMAFGFDLDWHGETYRYLYAFAVAAEHRRQGLGAVLLNAFETAARRAGCVGILAVVAPEGPWNFYRRRGYASVLRRRPRHCGESIPDAVSYPEVFMEAARAFGETGVDFVPDPSGAEYGVIKRFDGTLPPEPPFLSLTLE